MSSIRALARCANLRQVQQAPELPAKLRPLPRPVNTADAATSKTAPESTTRSARVLSYQAARRRTVVMTDDEVVKGGGPLHQALDRRVAQEKHTLRSSESALI